MTYIARSEYSIPIHPRRVARMSTPGVDPNRITVVVPTKDDLDGLVQTLRSLQGLNHCPSSIRVIDDGSRTPVTRRLVEACIGTALPNLTIHRNPVNLGPAAARTRACQDANGWIYFTDCACQHPPDLFDILATARNNSSDTTVAISTPVVAGKPGLINDYMTAQGNLCPPMRNGAPQTVITASCLVHSTAGNSVGWFDHRFRMPGGEDFDFGLRLSTVGEIAWQPDAEVFHSFEESTDDFDKRFVRYGEGMRILAEKWKVNLRPYEFQACETRFQALADRQFHMMLRGYEA